MKPKPKQDVVAGKIYAEGGSGKMVRPQAAGPAKAGITGKIQSPAPGKRAAAGGPKTHGVAVSTPAKAGHTSPTRKGR
jgi:hypothetical protein